MSRVPKASFFIDDEERELAEAIEADDHLPGESLLVDGDLERYAAIARHTIEGEKTKITIRLSTSDLSKLKARAMAEGMPYQTLIGSILHKAVS